MRSSATNGSSLHPSCCFLLLIYSTWPPDAGKPPPTSPPPWVTHTACVAVSPCPSAWRARRGRKRTRPEGYGEQASGENMLGWLRATGLQPLKSQAMPWCGLGLQKIGSRVRWYERARDSKVWNGRGPKTKRVHTLHSFSNGGRTSENIFETLHKYRTEAERS